MRTPANIGPDHTPDDRPVPRYSSHALLGAIITELEAMAARIPNGHDFTSRIARLRQMLANVRD
jgi:hypothetical protein